MSPQDLSTPEGFEINNLPHRHRTGRVWRIIFQVSTLIGIISLALLLINITNESFGYAVIEYKVDRASLESEGVPLEEMSEAQLIQVIQENVSSGRLKTLEKEEPLAKRSQEELLEIIKVDILKPKAVETFLLIESLFRKSEIEALVAEEHPEAKLEFKRWLTWEFINSPQSSDPLMAGIQTAILGSIWIIFITILFAFPIGIMAAVYLEEYATQSRLQRIIQTNINTLAGVPSIIYGILGLTIFVFGLAPLTSGEVFGNTTESTANGRTIISAGLTMGLLVLPLLIINSQEAIRAVPRSLREAGYGLGATKWQVVWHHVLPNALAGILTGTILSVSRAIGETAPLVVIGASTFINYNPDSFFSKFTSLPIQIYQWTSRPQDVFRNIAAAAIIGLLILLLAMNTFAIFLRNRYTRRL